MAKLHVRLRNAKREPLDDRADVRVTAHATNALVREVRNHPGTRALRFDDLTGGQAYLVQAFPVRHRPVGHFVVVPEGKPASIELFCPLHPDRVTRIEMPGYAQLPPDLRTVLERSTVEGPPRAGADLYNGLTQPEQGGLLNLFAKMRTFAFEDGLNVWNLVQGTYRIRPDRIFVDVDSGLRDRIKSAVVSRRFKSRDGEDFRTVGGQLHKPPPGYDAAGSFKTTDPYGNLQLTFFVRREPPLSFKVDADIDDAAGVGHVFQVLRNWVTDGETHPYDIHQILVFRQDVQPLYELA